MNFHQLRERVREAAGPCRELDRDICNHLAEISGLYVEKEIAPDAKGENAGTVLAPLGLSAGFQYPPIGKIDRYFHVDRLPVTGSLDAAAKLIPPGHDWALHVDNGEAIAGCMPASEDGCDHSDFHAATPALALCGAALSALITQENEDG